MPDVHVESGRGEAAMRMGCCVSMLASAGEPVGMEFIPRLRPLGYDYVELPLAEVCALSEETFGQLLGMLEEQDLPCECCNNFFPADVRLTGPQVSRQKQREFVARAMDRAARLGVKVVVFGSSRAKNMPDGFETEEGLRQVAQTMTLVLPYAQKLGISIAVEPLNRGESNLICNLREAMEFLHRLGSPRNMGVVVDYYHFSLEGESLSILEEVKAHILHLHFADPAKRMCPTTGCTEYARFFETVTGQGYAGRMSLEAYADNPCQELKQALDCLSQYTG